MSNKEHVLICAHRGASPAHPDNTIAAFEGARAEKADWGELDVRISRDGELVVSHDAWFGDGRGVWETPAADRPSEVVVLDQALDACQGMGVNIEIKNSAGDLGGDDVPRDLQVCDLVVELVATRAAEARAAGEPE